MLPASTDSNPSLLGQYVLHVCLCKATYMNKGEILNPETKSDKYSEMETNHHLYNSHFTPSILKAQSSYVVPEAV